MEISAADLKRLLLRAYRTGWDHFYIGDDVRSVDYLTDDEIVAQVYKDENIDQPIPKGDIKLE